MANAKPRNSRGPRQFALPLQIQLISNVIKQRTSLMEAAIAQAAIRYVRIGKRVRIRSNEGW